ncbi:MAG: acetolactate synthase [Planctomycetota bacterium]
MSQGEDYGSGIEMETMRGRDYPAIRQFTVFLENRVGVLLGINRRFRGTKVKILALSIIDSTECCIVRFVLSHPEQGREILESAGLAMIESDLIAIELSDIEQPLLEVFSALLRAEVNLVQAYPLMVPRSEKTIVAIMVDNIDSGQQTLSDQGFRLITENELMDMSE